MARPGPTFPYERFVTRVPDEDVHLEAQVVGWVASSWLRVGDPRVHNLNVLHVALVKLIHELWEPLKLDWVVSEVLELVNGRCGQLLNFVCFGSTPKCPLTV